MSYAELAAHVDHPVTHTSSLLKVGAALAGAVVGGLVVCGLTGGMGCLAGAAAIGSMGTGISVGMGLAGFVPSSAQPVSVAGQLISGFPKVKLGVTFKDAARAFADSVASCDSAPVAQGSKTVMMGPEIRPMSRRADEIATCKGKIADGLRSVIVGGEPTTEGLASSEKDRWFVTAIGVLGSLMSIPKSVNEAIAATTVRTAVQKWGAAGASLGAAVCKATDAERCSNLMSGVGAALGGAPSNLLEGTGQVLDARDGLTGVFGGN